MTILSFFVNELYQNVFEASKIYNGSVSSKRINDIHQMHMVLYLDFALSFDIKSIYKTILKELRAII